MFKKRAAPPVGLIRSEEFAKRVGIGIGSVNSYCNTGQIVRLHSWDFGILADDEIIHANYGTGGVIPESEVERFIEACWRWNPDGGIKPLAVHKVREFVCQPGNEALLARLIGPTPTEDGRPEEPGEGEYGCWDLCIIYGGTEEPWRERMKKGILRHRLLWSKGRTTMVALSGEVDFVARHHPELLPREIRNRLKSGGSLIRKGGLKDYDRIRRRGWSASLLDEYHSLEQRHAQAP